MMNRLTEEQIYEEAKKRVQAKKAFRTHLTTYLLVNILLVLIWAFASGGFPWFIFPLGGWGIGLFFHYMDVYKSGRAADSAAIEKEVEIIRREQS